jgi:hypothetical protein
MVGVSITRIPQVSFVATYPSYLSLRLVRIDLLGAGVSIDLYLCSTVSFRVSKNFLEDSMKMIPVLAIALCGTTLLTACAGQKVGLKSKSENVFEAGTGLYITGISISPMPRAASIPLGPVPLAGPVAAKIEPGRVELN